MKAPIVDFGSGLTIRELEMHNKSLKQPSYTIVTTENIWSLPFDCVHKKIIALFIDGVKLSTLKSLGQCGLINRLDSCSQFTRQLKAGGIKYIPLLLYKCKRPSRQNPSSKLIVIKTPTARTDREIKSQHQIQHAIQLNKTQDNNISLNQSHAPTVGYLNTFNVDLYLIWHQLNRSNKYQAFTVLLGRRMYRFWWQWVKKVIISQ